MATAAPRKELTVIHEADRCRLALFVGSEPAALSHALEAKLGLAGCTYYLTEDGSDVVVPLAAALPAEMTLRVHVTRSERSCRFGRRRASDGSSGGGDNSDEVRRVSKERRGNRARAATDGHFNFNQSPVEHSNGERHSPQTSPLRARAHHDASRRTWTFADPETHSPRQARPTLRTPLLVMHRKVSGLEEPIVETMERHESVSSHTSRDGSPASRSTGDHKADGRLSVRMSSRASSRRRTAELDAGAFEHIEDLEEALEDAMEHAVEHVEDAAEAMAQAGEAMAESVDRFSRLSADLANERTLLAWMRTCLAAIRTTFTYLAITAVDPLGMLSVLSTTWAMVMVMVLCCFCGVTKYRAIKKALLAKKPENHFNRMSNLWVSAVVCWAAIATGCGVCTQVWMKG